MQRAERPRAPSVPDVPFSLISAMTIGLILGTGLVFVFEYFDSTIGTPQQARRKLNLATIGVVPQFNSGRHGSIDRIRSKQLPFNRAGQKSLPLPSRTPGPKDLMVAHHPFSIVAESYRSIRTSLLFHHSDKHTKVVLLTSPVPGEGKTETTLNLAIALAQDGYKTLVIDGDVRKGCCHARLGLRNHVGLTNVLSGETSSSQIIQPTAINSLRLLTRGFCPPNPSELLGSNRMRRLIADMREIFDFVLIDSPPVVPVTDATVLATMSDGVLLVLHGKDSTMASARQALDRLGAVRARVLGTIINSIDLHHPDYSYYQHYYTYHSEVIGAAKTSENGVQRKQGATGALNGDGVVPPAYLEHMISKLTDLIGPIAPLLVRDQIRILGEPLNAFPHRRLDELVEKLCEEILDENLRHRFKRSMAEPGHAV
jgi:capsular exopolysaccharide synthesis family protein